MVLYEEVNGSASHITLNYLQKKKSAFVFLSVTDMCGNKEKCALMCGNMTTFIYLFMHHLDNHSEGMSRFDLDLLCMRNELEPS